MEIEEKKQLVGIRYLMPVLSLLALGILLGYIAILSLDLYNGPDVVSENQKKAYLRLCFVTFTALCITIVLTACFVIRWIRTYSRACVEDKPTEYVDAWSEAGKRIQVPEEEDEM